MAQMKVIACQDHGGSFRIPIRRGRPPSRCTPENPCDMVKKPATRNGRRPAPGNRPVDKVAREVKARVDARTRSETPSHKAKRATNIKAAEKATQRRKTPSEKVMDALPLPGTKTGAEASPATVRHNPSIPLAKRAKDLLEPQGWNLKGRQWVDEADSAWAEVTGTRGEETIVIRWQDGKFVSQDYSLWDADKTPGQNGLPASALKIQSRLPFDPDEMSDAELAAELAGRTVTWWNRLASSTETAVIGNKLKIEHTYTGGHETARQIHFVDATPGHAAFRAFNVDALMKVR